MSGVTMLLHGNGPPQSALVLDDLKPGDTAATVALWFGGGTEAYFANLRLWERLAPSLPPRSR